MAVKAKEYFLSIDNLSKPKVVTGQEAIAYLLIRLLLLNPGSDPLHPEMGVGLEDFRFCIGRIEELENQLKVVLTLVKNLFSKENNVLFPMRTKLFFDISNLGKTIENN